MNIDLSRIHFPIHSLGPGARIGIWFQGCSIRCPGCISTDTWAFGKGTIAVDRLITEISSYLQFADGITITGGEPFDQPEALRYLLRDVRQIFAKDVLVYSGYAIENLEKILPSFDGLIDALISEPFIIDAPATLALRGSDNQKIHFLTAEGLRRFKEYDRQVTDADRHLDIMLDDVGPHVWIAGIPRRGDLTKLKQYLAQSGHRAHTTEHRIDRSDPDLS